MNPCQDESNDKKPAPAGDLAKLRELGVVCSAEFIVQASCATSSSLRVAEAPPAPQRVGGRFIAGRAGFFTAAYVEKTLADLQHQLSQDAKFHEGESLDQLIALWMALEPYLQPAEVQKYWPDIERRLSGGRASIIAPSRAGARQGGGH